MTIRGRHQHVQSGGDHVPCPAANLVTMNKPHGYEEISAELGELSAVPTEVLASWVTGAAACGRRRSVRRRSGPATPIRTANWSLACAPGARSGLSAWSSNSVSVENRPLACGARSVRRTGAPYTRSGPTGAAPISTTYPSVMGSVELLLGGVAASRARFSGRSGGKARRADAEAGCTAIKRPSAPGSNPPRWWRKSIRPRPNAPLRRRRPPTRRRARRWTRPKCTP